MIRAIVTDIEGTTSSISFVADVLFPYAAKHLSSYVDKHHSEPQIAAVLNDVRDEMDKPNASLSDVIATLLQWIKEDKKITPLKTLQGFIWGEGYASGELTGHIYADAAANLRKWHEQGIRLYVYSSGSVAAQKLIFGHSEEGDLTYLFDGYFDTHVGGKREPSSYHAIAAQLQLPASEILFLSDIVFELDAAAAVGVRTIALDRQCIGEGFGIHQVVHSFDDIHLSAVP